MKAEYLQKGESLDYINTTTKKIEAGDALIVGNRIGIAGTDIDSGQLGSIHVSGVYGFTKKDKAELTIGMEVYLSEDGITTTAEGNTRAGFVAATSATTNNNVYVKINA